MSRADLILKLNVGKDKRTVAPVETGGHISYFFKTYSANLKKILLINLIYAGIFALPLIFSLFVLPMLVDRYVYLSKSFIGNFGIGFPGTADNLLESIHAYHSSCRKMIYPCILGSVFIAFVGLSGVFHCSRGFLWQEKVKVKSFFRGIKQLWKPFMITGAFTTAILAGVLYGFDWHSELLQTTGATAGSYVVAIVCGLAAVFTVGVLMIFLPSFACYNFKFGEHLKNTFIFLAVMPIQTVFVMAFSAGLCLLTLINSMIGIILGVFLVSSGFFFFAMIWTTYGQYLFDGFICTQVDKEGNRVEVQIKKKSAKDNGEYVGAKKTSESKKNNNQQKTTKKNTYNSSYKRKKK